MAKFTSSCDNGVCCCDKTMVLLRHIVGVKVRLSMKWFGFRQCGKVSIAHRYKLQTFGDEWTVMELHIVAAHQPCWHPSICWCVVPEACVQGTVQVTKSAEVAMWLTYP